MLAAVTIMQTNNHQKPTTPATKSIKVSKVVMKALVDTATGLKFLPLKLKTSIMKVPTTIIGPSHPPVAESVHVNKLTKLVSFVGTP